MNLKIAIAGIAAITMGLMTAQANAAPLFTEMGTAKFSTAPAATTFILVGSKKQCLRQCTKLDNSCRKKVRKKGDANGWDGDLRRSEWEDTCAPKVSRCQTKCGPIGPAECRIDTQGNEYCS